nr:S46 family peptidase [Pyrinomonadaceae bacterium]
MNLRTNRFVSVAMMVALVFSSFSFTLAVPDEGMFPPDKLAGLNLKKKGLKIKPEEIYNPNGGGLTDAVIRLSIGCSAEFVSPDGLILTNHHCGFDALVSASTPEKDLVETGFNAGSRSGEISAKDYSIMLTQRIEDVTAKIKAGTENLSGAELAAAIKKNTDDLTAAEKAAHPGSTITIQMLNNGYYYYLYQTTDVKDIRVVYA